MNNNRLLQMLRINDIKSLIAAAKNPNLKAAILEHPKLAGCDQGLWGDSDETLLKGDIKVVWALVRNIVENPNYERQQ